MRAWLCPLLIVVAAPVHAAPSLCAHLPKAGKIAVAAPDDVMPPRPRPDRKLECPPGFALNAAARPPVCRRPGQAAEDGDPRAACHASLVLGPVADVPAQWRPTRSCPSGAITSLVRLEGTNIGLGDVAVSTQTPGVKAKALDEDSPGLEPAQRPSAQGCFAHQCRLVQLEVSADAPDAVRLELAIEDGEKLILAVPLTSHCDDPVARPVPAGPRHSTIRTPVTKPPR